MDEVNRVISSPSRLVGEISSDRRPRYPNVSFIYPPKSNSFKRELDRISYSWEIESEIEIGSKRKFVGWFAVLFKRLVRVPLAWYLNPIVEQIRRFNMLVTRAFHEVSHALDDLEKRIGELEARVSRLYESEGESLGAESFRDLEGGER